MVSQIIKLENESGLHARPATVLSKLANSFQSKIIIKYMEKEGNAKSVLAIMALGIKEGSEFEIICEGEDEEKALNSIVDGFKNKFGEE